MLSALLQIAGGDKLIIPFADGAVHEPFKGRHFQRDIILGGPNAGTANTASSYRELQEMLAERAVNVDHSDLPLGSALCA